MQRERAKSAYGYVESTRAERAEQPMSMLEAAIFFGVLSLILDGIGAVVARVIGLDYRALVCLLFFVLIPLIMAAGFVGARYTTTINGVWAGVMVAAINSVFSQIIYVAALPEYRAAVTTSAETQQAIPGAILGIVITIYVVVGGIVTILGGAFWGFIGAAIAQLGIFKPKDAYYADEY
jgi:lysylphosphatidylglycerol synthetase-like protein (DUF2156 family)